MGPSGSGKSTLLHCLAALDTVTSGEVIIGDTSLTGLNDKALTALRRDRVGFVFQAFNLVPTLNGAREHPAPVGHRRPRARHRSGTTPSSRGRPRRPAVTSPTSCPADSSSGWPAHGHWRQPAGDRLRRRADRQPRLHGQRRGAGFLRRSVDEFDQTVVMVTHDPVAAAYTDRVVFLADGTVVDELRQPSADAVLEKIKVLSVREVAGTAAEG